MTPELIHDLMIAAMVITLKVCLPLLLTSLAIGIIISIFQALTQIQENTLAFVPKLLAVFGVLALSMGYMGSHLGSFTQELYNHIVQGR